jgi:hypothetical protein
MCFHESTTYLGQGDAYTTGSPHLCDSCEELLVIRERSEDSAPQFWEVDDIPEMLLIIEHLTGRETGTL